MLVGCRALGMGGGSGWAPEEDKGSLGSDAGGKLGVAGDGDGVLPFRRSRLDPPMWLEWFDPGWVPAVEGWDILPRGRRNRWSSSSLPPSRAKLREGGGSMAPVYSQTTHKKEQTVKRGTRENDKEPQLFIIMIVTKDKQSEWGWREGGVRENCD